MKLEDRAKLVKFIDEKLYQAYESLLEGTFEEKALHQSLERAFNDLKKNPFSGIKISARLWPKEYKKYGITNLRKYNLPNAWRLMYTLEGNEIEIVSILLEWLSHKEYEKRFGYKVK